MEEAERASKKTKTEEDEDAKDVEDARSEYKNEVMSWTDEKIIEEYNDLCNEFRDLYISVGCYRHDGKSDTISENLAFYMWADDTECELFRMMKVVLDIADERDIPGDRSEGEQYMS